MYDLEEQAEWEYMHRCNWDIFWLFDFFINAYSIVPIYL